MDPVNEETMIIDSDIEILDDVAEVILTGVVVGCKNSENLVTVKNIPNVKPPKNLILVEGDPPDEIDVPTKREIRSFPDEECLSAKIKMANGTDYSNHYIEQHFNPRSEFIPSTKNYSKKKSEDIGVFRYSSGMKESAELSSHCFSGLDDNPAHRRQEVIDISLDGDSDNEVEITGFKENQNVGDDVTSDKSNLKLNRISNLPKLVPYSLSEEEMSDNDGNEDSSLRRTLVIEN